MDLNDNRKLAELQQALPEPEDDGAAEHLPGMTVPKVSLPSTQDGEVDLFEAAVERLVLYLFPGMGPPDQADPPGWMQTPGAYGCTEQSCSFRDMTDSFGELGYRVAGVSAQPQSQQREAAERLELSYPLLADPDRHLDEALKLPTFDVDGQTYYKRLTFVAERGEIVKVFYPVFPPWENPGDVLAWIRAR